MKQRKSYVLGFVKAVVLLLVVAMSFGMMVACTEDKAVSAIEVSELTNQEFYALEGFKISTFKLKVTYEDETTGEIVAADSMLTTEGKNDIKTAGEKSITLYYKGQTTTVDFTLVESGEELVRVSFKNANGELIASKLTLVGGSVTAPEAPEIDGQYFDTWVDSNGNEVNLDELTESITVTAHYSASSTKCEVVIKDYNGKEISRENVAEGTWLQEPHYLRPSNIKEIKWSVTFPYQVLYNVTINMQAVYESMTVQYAYAYRSSLQKLTYLNDYTEVVEYGGSIDAGTGKSNYTKALETVRGLFTDVTEPSDNHVIKSDTTFVFIVPDPSINVVVYNDPDMKSVMVDKKSYVIGSSFTFPLNAPDLTIEGQTFDSWRVYNVKTKKFVADKQAKGQTWTVSEAYGTDIAVVPYFRANYINVTFRFFFADILLNDTATEEEEKYYNADVAQNEKYIPNDADCGKVAYGDITSLLETIKKNKKMIDDGSESEAGQTAKSNLADYAVMRVVYNGSYYSFGDAVEVASSDMTVKVYLLNVAAGTRGLRYTAVYALNAAPEIAFQDGETLVGFFYNGNKIETFPYVLDGAYEANKFTYKYTDQSGQKSGKVTDYKATKIGYTVSGIDLVSGEENDSVFLPDTHKEEGDEVAVPVIGVAEEAFKNKNLTIGHISKDITEIGAYAFAGCTLYDVTEFAALQTIGEGAFENATLQNEVVFAKAETIGQKAFKGLNTQEYDREIYTKTNEKVYTATTTLVFKSDVKTVSEEAFYGVGGTLSLVFEKDITTIEKSAFRTSEGLTALSGIDKVTVIKEYAFEGTGLTALDLPALQEFGEGAFTNMKNLQTLTLGGQGGSLADTFVVNDLQGDVALTVLTVGDGVLYVTGDLAGAQLPSLTEINLPKTTESIENSFAEFPSLVAVNVAEGCAKYYGDAGVLYKVTTAATQKTYTLVWYPTDKIGTYSVNLPVEKDVTRALTLVPEAFNTAVIAVLDVSALDKDAVTVSDGTMNAVIYAIFAKKDGSMDETKADKLDSVLYTFQDSITEVTDYTDIYVPEYKMLFTKGKTENTVLVKQGYRKATEIVVPKTVSDGSNTYTVVGVLKGAFSGFTALETLTIEATLDSFDKEVFGNDTESCSALTTLSVAGWSENAVFSGEKATVTADSFKHTKWYDENFIISVGGHPFLYNSDVDVTVLTAEMLSASGFVDKIPANFFSGATKLTSVSFPDSITIIYEKAFAECTSLQTVSFNKVYRIEKEAFSGCTALEKVDVPYLNTLGRGAFMTCKALTEVNMPKLEKLPVKAFTDCSKLETVSFPAVKTFLEDDNGDSSAFQNCAALRAISFPNCTADHIPAKMFYGSGLKTFDFSAMKTVTGVQEQAFAYCSSLVYVVFGPEVVYIEDSAFAEHGVGTDKLVVRILYGSLGLGLYKATTEETYYYRDADGKNGVAKNAFENTDVYFFIDEQQTPQRDTFLKDFNDAEHISANIPQVTFDFYDTYEGLTLGLSAKSEIYWTGIDAPDFSEQGYTFVGWYDGDASMANPQPLQFPFVVTSNTTFYARYLSKTQGSLDATNDVKFVYMLTTEPEISLADGETVKWYYSLNGSNNVIDSFPFIVYDDVNAKSVISVYAEITEVGGTTKVEYGNIGRFGYAVIAYYSQIATDVLIPEYYNDGTNGQEPIVAVYAGAFNKSGFVLKELDIPASVEVLMANTTGKAGFGSDLESISLPASLKHIDVGVFDEATDLKVITFGENSLLKEVSREVFVHTAWYRNAVNEAERSDGFVLAGRTAIEYVGETESIFITKNETDVIQKNYWTSGVTLGIDTDSMVEQTVSVLFYDADGQKQEPVTYTGTGRRLEDNTYAITLTAAGYTDIYVVLDVDKKGKYQEGGVSVAFDTMDETVSSVRFAVSAVKIISVPETVIKLADGILKGNKSLMTLSINANLEEIGKEAFLNNVALLNVKNSDAVANMKLTTVGEDAFTGTPWYQTGDETGRVVIGPIFLQYNNKGYSKTVAIDDSVTKIAGKAFSKTNNLDSVTFGAKSALKEIEANAFSESTIRNVELPAGVEIVGRGAFQNCTSLLLADLSKTKIVKLDREVFAGCSRLTTLKLPNTTVELGADCVKGDVALADIQADGISSLQVSGTQVTGGYTVSFESCLNDTAWYNVEAGEDDIFLTLGNVLVKYCMGSVQKEKAQSVLDVETKETVLVEIPENLGIVTILDYAFTANSFATPNVYSGVNVYVDVVRVSSTVEVIGSYAFVSCKTLQEVRFAEQSALQNIEEFAFYDCSALSTVVLPEGLSEIGKSAFQKTAIKTVVENEKGERVSDEGFVLPSTVVSVGESAFADIKTLTVVSLNSALVSLGLNAFNEGSDGKLYKVLWDIDTEEIKDEQGMTVDNGFTQLNNALKANGVDIQMINFFTSGTNIRMYFDENDYDYLTLKRTTGAANQYNLWKDGKIVFKEAGDYPKVTLATGTDNKEYKYEFIKEGDLPVPYKEGNTFRGWKVDNKEVTYPYTVTSEVTFEAQWIENAPASVDVMVEEGNATFTVAALTDSKKETSITSVSGEVLYVLESVAGYKITSFALEGNTTVKKLILTSAVNFNGLEVNPFYGFTALESISVPNDADLADFIIEEVVLRYTTGEGDNAKDNTKVCQVIYSADKTKLIAFIGNASYTQIVDGQPVETGLEFAIPNGVTEIYKNAFINSHLATVSLPSSLTKIGEHAFNKELKSFKIAKNIYISEANYNVFEDISSEDGFWNSTAKSANYDTYIEVKGAKVAADNDKSGYFYILGNIVLAYEPNGSKAGSAQKLTFLEKSNDFDITVLAENMFGLVKTDCVFSDVILPKNVKKINKNAFNNCEIEYFSQGSYNSLNDIADDVFKDKKFYDDHNSGLLIIGHVLVKGIDTSSVVQVPEGVVLIMKNAFATSKATEIRLPSTLVTISEAAFANEQKLTSIVIPNGVVTIGAQAFNGCTALISVTFDTVESKLSSIGDKAFLKCDKLTTIALPYSLEKLGKNVFRGCTALQTITFDGYEEEQTETGTVMKKVKDSKLTTIGEGTFSQCSALTEISIPNGVTAIEQSTFENCITLEKVNFDITNSRLTTIGESAFSGCVKLGSKLNLPESNEVLSLTDDKLLVTLELPNALISVGDNAFSGCEGLWGVEFNYNVNELGSSIFAGCNNLVKVVFNRATPASVQSDTFNVGNEARYRLRIYVPQSINNVDEDSYGPAMEKYITAWKDITINNTSDGSNGESIKYFLYEQGDLPTFYYTDGSETSAVMKGDVIINPYYKWKNATTTSSQTYKDGWEYDILQQGATKDGGATYHWYYSESDSDFPATAGEHEEKVHQYGTQTIGEYVICVIDYDIVGLKRAQ